MGTDYALVYAAIGRYHHLLRKPSHIVFRHLYYTIPPAILLSAVYRPLSTALDWYKVGFLLLIAVVSTIPWDSYLVRNRIWTYPPEAVLGPTLFQIPLEEVFFFVIQTYNTSIIYLLLNKPTFFPTYLRAADGSPTVKDCFKIYRLVGQCFLACLVAFGGYQVHLGGRGTYLGLILIWAVPFLFLLWSLAYQFIIGLPWACTVLPIAITTLYLWIVDTLALRRGTWVIESGTKLGMQLWNGLEIEEALFFLITNMLVVFGLTAFDNSIAIIEAFPDIFPTVPTLPSPLSLVKALLLPTSSYDPYRILGFQQALERLRLKSRSFYLASGVFHGRTRIDLTLLYAFCRVADDLVDNASSPTEVESWIQSLNQYLDLKYSPQPDQTKLSTFIFTTFPPRTHTILILLPTSHLPSKPLYGLIRGFVTDLNFSKPNDSFPIATERHLFDYASNVAGTVGELVLSTIYHYIPSSLSYSIDTATRTRCINAGFRMGVALQYVNIARDIAADAAERRVYLPTAWLSESSPPLTPQAIISTRGTAPGAPALRKRLLNRAFDLYYENRDTIEELPAQSRGPVRVAVEGYMEIGRVILDGKYAEDKRKGGRATVPKMRRLWVGWKALNGVRGGSGGTADGAL